MRWAAREDAFAMTNLTSLTNPMIIAITAIGLLLTGLVDYLTGLEIRVFPLYFVPLVFAAWLLGPRATALFSGLATIIWVVANYAGGREYSHAYIWMINFFTQGSAFLLVPMLVAALHQALVRERDLARIDPLTGLANRRSFYADSKGIVELCHRHNRAISIAYIDLDNFKQANDQFGHEFGDRLLQTVARILRSILRTSDRCCRVGGDEFIILLPETSEADARAVLERIRLSLADEKSLFQASVTASIGAVSYEQAPLHLEPMVVAADELMYRVKTSSKNQVYIEGHGAETRRPDGRNMALEVLQMSSSQL